MASTLIHMAPFSGMLIWKKTDPAREKHAGLHSVRETRRGTNHAVSAVTNECAPGHKATR